MENLNLILAICIIIPLCMMIFVFKNQSRTVLIYLILGVFTCLLSSEISGLILNTSGLTKFFMTINITPIIEEILKALPIVFITFLLKPDRQLLLECSLAIGVGFAIMENIYIFSQMGYSSSIGWALTRGFGAGMMHGICTLFVGYTLTSVHKVRKLAFTGTFAALSVAIIYHSIYNIIVQSEYKTFGILLPLATFIPWIIVLRFNKNKVNTEITKEAQ